MDNNFITFLVLVFIVSFIVVPVVRKRNSISKKKSTPLSGLPNGVRYATYDSKDSDSDIDRLGRWKVRYLDGSETTKMGKLSKILTDNLRSFSPAVSYREIP